MATFNPDIDLFAVQIESIRAITIALWVIMLLSVIGVFPPGWTGLRHRRS